MKNCINYILFLLNNLLEKIVNFLLNNKVIRKIILNIFRIKATDIEYLRFMFGSLVVVDKDKAYKIAIYPKSLSIEINNRKILNSHYPNLQKIILETHYTKKLWFNALIMDTLQTIEINELSIATTLIQKSFNQYMLQVKEKKRINDFIYIKKGLEIIKLLCEEDDYVKLSNYINNAISKQTYFGPSHGDFHRKNILKDMNGNYYIIDLDCFRKFNFIWMDELYCLVEFLLEIKFSNVENWMDMVALLDHNTILSPYLYNNFNLYDANDNNIHEILGLFFFDRLGQELKYVNNALYALKIKKIKKFLRNFIETIKD